MERFVRIYPALVVLGIMFAGFVWYSTSTDNCQGEGKDFHINTWWYSCE